MNQAIYNSETESLVDTAHLLNRILVTVLWSSLCIFPVIFGGVHAEVYLTAYAIIFLLTGTILLREPRGIAAWLDKLPLTKTVFSVLGMLITYLFANGLIRLLLNQSHPILGSVSLLYSPHEYFNTWISIVASTAFFTLIAYTLAYKITSIEYLLRLLSISGSIVSLIALSHWFYDNGRLFWIFSPEHIFVSERARWPFVSANNLGHHLILTLFPTLYLLIRGVRHLFRIIDTLAARRPVSLLDLVNTPGVQMKMLRIVIDLFSTLCIALAILASQSRGSWIGSCIGVLIYLWLDRRLQRIHELRHPNESFEILRDRRKKSRPLEGVTFFDTFIFLVRKLSFAFGMILAATLLLLFLRDRGLDMVLNRAEYGLLSSKDDIRWVMYHNTIPMIVAHPIFGVGLGAWNLVIGQYIDPTLARLNPVYLHSDPLQFLAETGIVGSAFILYLFVAILRCVVSSIQKLQTKDAQKVLCLACGLTALLIGSFFDFPFRIPSISLLFIYALSLMCFIMDADTETNRTDIAH